MYVQVLKDIAHLLPLTLACLRVLPAETNTKIMCMYMITNFVFSPSHSLLTTSLLVQIIRGVELLAIKDQIYSQVLKDIAHLLPLTLACLRVLPAETNTKIMCITNFVFSPSHSLLTTSLLVQIIRGVELLAIKDQIYSQVLKDIAHLLPLTLACLRVLPAETNTKIMCMYMITNFVFSPSHSLLTIYIFIGTDHQRGGATCYKGSNILTSTKRHCTLTSINFSLSTCPSS